MALLPLSNLLPFAKESRMTVTAPRPIETGSATVPHLFQPITLRGLKIRNRIWMAPMCQYSEAADGPDTGTPNAGPGLRPSH